MQPLVKRLHAACADAGNYPVPAIELLLREAAREIERLQRMAYRQSSARPADFKGVRHIRQRHEKDDHRGDFEGRALLAHADRATLLAIVAFLSTAADATSDSTDETPMAWETTDSVGAFDIPEHA